MLASYISGMIGVLYRPVIVQPITAIHLLNHLHALYYSIVLSGSSGSKIAEIGCGRVALIWFLIIDISTTNVVNLSRVKKGYKEMHKKM